MDFKILTETANMFSQKEAYESKYRKKKMQIISEIETQSNPDVSEIVDIDDVPDYIPEPDIYDIGTPEEIYEADRITRKGTSKRRRTTFFRHKDHNRKINEAISHAHYHPYGVCEKKSDTGKTYYKELSKGKHSRFFKKKSNKKIRHYMHCLHGNTYRKVDDYVNNMLIQSMY